jgi:putative redox protein
VKWVEGVTFVAESGSGHAMVIDGPAEHGGRNLGPRPMETVLMGLGACSAFDVMSILSKARQQVTSCHVELDAERADAVPAVFTRVHMRYVIRGRGLRRSAAERAVRLSVDKYCSVTAMLRPRVEVTHEVVLQEDEG